MNQAAANDDASIKRIGGIVMQVAGPALAILVVYSIAAFLVEIFYQSAMVERVKWIFFLFTFAAVLISRISIEEGYERASIFGFLLGLAILITSARLLQGNPLALVFILTFVWWSAGRLTWDCTFIDETRDATGQGMIDLAIERVNRFRKGELDPDRKAWDDCLPPDPHLVHGADSPVSEAAKSHPTAWDKFVSVFWRRKQANTPGLWAFYFLLMGLPLFGIGQLLLRMTDQAAHRAAAGHFFWYITGLLGLLMLTSVLGLHRYLERNQSSMPGRLARRWITAGTILAIGITGFCFLLPRPTAQYSIGSWLPKLTSRNVAPSDQSFGNDGQQQAEKNSNVDSGPQSRQDRGEQNQQDGQSQQGNAEKSINGAPQDKVGGDTEGGKSGGGKKGSGGKEKSKSKGKSEGKKSKGGSGQQKGGDSKKSDSKSKQSNSGEKGDQQKGDQKQDGQNKSDQQKSNDDNKEKGGLKTRNKRNQKKADRKKQQGSRSSSRPPPRQQPKSDPDKKKDKQDQKQLDQKKQSSNLMALVTKFFRFIAWLIALLVIFWFAIKHRDRIMPWIRSFIAELQEFWNRLWNREKKVSEAKVAEPEVSKPRVRLPGFNQYKNPFASDAARTWSAERLVSYTFEAFEAWSRDHQCAREPDQTAYEFVSSTVAKFKPLNKEANYLAGLYCQLAYANPETSSSQAGPISRSAAAALSPLWEKLTRMYSPNVSE